MKKSALGIYVIMIVLGLVGIFVYATKSEQPARQIESHKNIPQETIAVAVATKDLKAESILQPDDFQIRNINVAVGSADKEFKITQPSLNNWAVNSSISSGAYISPKMLVEPGTDEYLSMFLQPGNVLYTFEISSSDNYLLRNVKPGQGIDVYMSYSLKQGEDGFNEIISPALKISESRLKPLFINKRVLAIRQAGVVNKNGVERIEGGSLIIAELKDNEIKLLKSLEGKAKMILFPSSQRPDLKTQGDNLSKQNEAPWPVINEPIFKFSESPRPLVKDVDELRG